MVYISKELDSRDVLGLLIFLRITMLKYLSILR
jgi:hypothetical protein